MTESKLRSDSVCLPIQKMVMQKAFGAEAAANSFAPRTAPGEFLRTDGILYIHDLCYGQKYPNSYFDVYRADQNTAMPVFINIHGGGYIFGDKVGGDPLTEASGGDADMCAVIAAHGFIVICPNYALSPEYRFPTQLKQLNELLEYLTDHADALRLDMRRVFLGGGSAGACISQMYAAMMVNDSYAESVGVKPFLQRAALKGLVLNEPSLSTKHFESRMNAMYGAWLGKDDPSAHEECVRLIEAHRWIKAPFFPTLVIASNREPFFRDAMEELVQAMEKEGCAVETFYRGEEIEKLPHGFIQDFRTCRSAREGMETIIDFMRRNQD